MGTVERRDDVMTTHELTDEEILALVKDLESIRAGSLAAAALVGCGERAIGPLRTLLLEGRPRGVYQPRMLAVTTLAELGARETLMEYVVQERPIEDAVVRFGEDAVRSMAARELGRWRDPAVFECLLDAGSRRLLPGIVESLGLFRNVEAMEFFLRALADDVCRANAEDAIRILGDRARPGLIDTAFDRAPSAEEERPSSLERRRRALALVADLEVSDQDWSRLRSLMEERDPGIVILAGVIGLMVGPTPDQWRAAKRIIEVLPGTDWFLQTEARGALGRHFAVAQELVEDEIARRMQASRKEQSLDLVLRLLVNLRDHAREKGPME
jgi:hypothetical protein